VEWKKAHGVQDYQPDFCGLIGDGTVSAAYAGKRELEKIGSFVL
jgi:hypothetical protein